MLLPQILSNNRIISLKCFDKIHGFLTQMNISTTNLKSSYFTYVKYELFRSCLISINHDFCDYVKMLGLQACHPVHTVADFDVAALVEHAFLVVVHELVLVVVEQIVYLY